LAEAALGMMGLRSCASLFSGSIMTGVALFFIASSWYLTKNILHVTLIELISFYLKNQLPFFDRQFLIVHQLQFQL